VARGGRHASLWLELVAHCNLNCAFCYNEWRPDNPRSYPRPMDFEEITSGVERLLDRVEFEFVALSGGEPLLSPILSDLVQWLNERQQWSILTTNGRAFNRVRAQGLKDKGLNGIQVPLLALDPKIHDTLSGRPCWDQAVTALALGLEFGLATSVTFVMTKVNAAQLPLVIGFLGQAGVRRITVATLQLGGSAIPNAPELRVPDDLALAIIRESSAVAVDSGVEMVTVPSREPATPGTRPWHRWSVSPGGELKLCNLSTKNLGYLPTMSDAVLDEVASDLLNGEIEKYRDRIDTCSCFDRATAFAHC
jgi:MoaA/NifB/PqqE/SkfB family radical SAM enzyme